MSVDYDRQLKVFFRTFMCLCRCAEETLTILQCNDDSENICDKHFCCTHIGGTRVTPRNSEGATLCVWPPGITPLPISYQVGLTILVVTHR